jgi:two-component system, chemotaxis family, sensor kinase CheA
VNVVATFLRSLAMAAHVTNASEKLLPDDMDDFVAECDEHLSAARRVLLSLETSNDLSSAGREQLDALFRAFHTVKGLSGMVGARAAEETAHGLETYLGAVRTGNPPLTEQGIDVLLEGVSLLEAVVAAFLGGEPAPATAALADRVAALLPAAAVQRKDTDTPRSPVPPEGLPEEKLSRLSAALARGERAWRLTFTPTPALAARGINVKTVRDRLQAAGEIVHAEPIPTPGGVRFKFLLAAPAAANLQGWADDGIEMEPYKPPSGQSVSQARPRSAAGIAPVNFVRVDLGRLDDLMRAVGELVLSRARLEGGLTRVAGYLPPRERRELEETAQAIERQLRDLREGVMRVRMVPVRDLFARMRLVVRDLTRETGKEVELVVTGEETEIDKLVVERMADPFLHLVRNAVSHGLESTTEREAAGKRPKGRITLRAVAAGGMIVLEVEDDGRGVGVDDVFARARKAGLVSPDATADPAAVLDLLCTPGFSTCDKADRGSGRGVGLDVVRLAVEGLGGTLTLDSRRGAGSRFTAQLPLTLVVADVLTVAVGGQTYAVPQTAVREVVPVEAGTTTILENNELVRYHGGVLPLLRLGDVFGLPRPAGAFVALVTGQGPAAVALAADRAVGLREVVVRALADPLVQAPGIGGATELGDGRPILILDPGGLARLARRGRLPARTGG